MRGLAQRLGADLRHHVRLSRPETYQRKTEIGGQAHEGKDVCRLRETGKHHGMREDRDPHRRIRRPCHHGNAAGGRGDWAVRMKNEK